MLICILIQDTGPSVPGLCTYYIIDFHYQMIFCGLSSALNATSFALHGMRGCHLHMYVGSFHCGYGGASACSHNETRTLDAAKWLWGYNSVVRASKRSWVQSLASLPHGFQSTYLLPMTYNIEQQEIKEVAYDNVFNASILVKLAYRIHLYFKMTTNVWIWMPYMVGL